MSTYKPYKRLLSYVRPYLARLAVAVVCIIAATSANLYVPWVVKEVIDKVLAEKDMAMLNTIAVTIIVVYLLRGIFYYGQTYLMSYVGQKVIIDIRQAVYGHMQRLSLSYHERKRTGTMMSYITNDVAAVQGALIESVIDLVTEGSVLIGSLAMMFYLHWQLSLLTLVTLPLVGVAINFFGKRLRRTSAVIQERVAGITSVLQEALSSVRVIKSFVREDYENERFLKENLSNFQAQMKNAQTAATLTPVIEFLAALGVTAIIWYGGWAVIQGSLTAGSLIAFLVYAINLSNPIKRLSKVYGNIQKALAAADRVFGVLDTVPEIQDLPGARDLPLIEGRVAFHDVTFEYKQGQPVLSNISLTADPGQMIAIVGSSGAGKTTIANLIPRFYEPIAGYISIDDVDIKTVTMQSLRRQIGIVPQETVLFNGTVYDNILYGDLEASRDAVIAAAKAANAHQFIMNMPDGYETQIGERGSKLSGGQRQRISIARAILKNPRVLILDEATSALDSESEQLVQQALDQLMVSRTSFVIAHRLSTVLQADQILVMERGRIIERGSHHQLLASGGIYSKLFQAQFHGKQAEQAD